MRVGRGLWRASREYDACMQHMCYREELFRVETGSSFRGMFLCLLLVGGSFVLVAHLMWGRPFYWFWDGVVAPLLYAILLLGAVWYLRMRLTVSVMPEGLRTFDVWGRNHVVPWGQVESARRWSFFGMPSARILCRELSTPLWLPLNLDDRERFDQLVDTYAGPADPLRSVVLPK